MTSAEIIHSKPAAAGLRQKLDTVTGAISKGFSAYINARSRTAQIDALNRKSDAELAKLGLERGDIVYHVWRDAFYL